MVKNKNSITADFAEEAAVILKTLAHPVRIHIIQCVESGEKSVSEITARTDIVQAVCSQHLRLMRDRGLLKARRQGTNVYYCIAHPLVLRILNCMKICIKSQQQGDQ